MSTVKQKRQYWQITMGNNGTWQGPSVSLSDKDTWLPFSKSTLLRLRQLSKMYLWDNRQLSNIYLWDSFTVYFVTCGNCQISICANFQIYICGNCQIYICGITDELHSASSYFTSSLPTTGMPGQKLSLLK